MKRFFVILCVAISLVTCAAAVFGQLFATRFWLADLFTAIYFQLLVLQVVLIFLGAFFRRLSMCCMSVLLCTLQLCFYPHLSAPIQQNSQAEELKILQFNAYNQNESLEPFVEFVLQEPSADIICLQEISNHQQDLAKLKKMYPYHTPFREMSLVNLAVFSKIPLASHRLIQDGSHFYVRISAKLPQSKEPFVLYNVHFFSPRTEERWESRNQSMDYVFQKVQLEAANHVMVVGDFNTPIYSPYLQDALDQSGLVLSTKRSVFSTWSLCDEVKWWNGVAIDHLFHSEEINALSEEVDDIYGSDHRPVLTTLYF